MSLVFEDYIKHQADGFTTENNIRSTTTISTSTSTSLNGAFERDITTIQNNLTCDLLKEIIKIGAVKFSKHIDAGDCNTVYTASVCIAPHGTEFTKVADDVFSINNEHFIEDDIKKALRHTFPERFV